MRRKSNLSLELFGDRLPAMQGSGGEPDAEYRKMLRALHAAMEGELPSGSGNASNCGISSRCA